MADLEWDRDFALEQSGDDEEMLAELLVLFRDSSASDLARINDALAAGKAAAELEKKGRAGDLSQGRELAAQLAALLTAFAERQ